MRFEYRFHDRGISISQDDLADERFWLDIGNVLMPGVIDHHSSGKYRSTVQALTDSLYLVEGLKGQERVIFNTHKYLDTDALFSIWLDIYSQ